MPAYFMIQTANSVPLTGKIELNIQIRAPKRMDSDALSKPIFDALQHGRVIVNDNQIRRYHVEKTDAREPRIVVVVREI